MIVKKYCQASGSGTDSARPEHGHYSPENHYSGSESETGSDSESESRDGPDESQSLVARPRISPAGAMSSAPAALRDIPRDAGERIPRDAGGAVSRGGAAGTNGGGESGR